MKKILTSLSIIGAVATIAIGGTTAYFSDIETSAGNTFTAGTLDLKVGSDDPTTWGFEIENIKPGDSGTATTTICNIGSIDGYLHITFDSLLNDENGCVDPEFTDEPGCGDDSVGELAKNLDLLIYIEKIGGTPDQFDLGTDTLVYQGTARGILQGDIFNYFLASNDSQDFRVEWDLPALTNNEAQSDKAGFNILFEITQNQKDIVGNWHFNEKVGAIAYDSSGKGNDGAISGASWADGQYNPALEFDGDDYIIVNDSDSLKPTLVTLEAWVKSPSSPGKNKYIAGKRYGGGWGSYHLYTGNTGGLKFYIGYDGGYIASPNVASADIWDGEWHHIVGTYDGSTVKLYVDSNEIPGGTGTTEDIVYNSQDFYMGSYGTGYYFSGLIDEVKVYSYALDGTEISERYQTGE